MFRIKAIIFIILFSLISFKAHSGEFFLHPEIGQNNTNFSADFTLTGESFSLSNPMISYRAGYQFENNLVLSAAFSYSMDVFFFGALDDYKIFNTEFAIGYAFQVSDNVFLEPSIGYNDWELDVQEGLLFNPGPEERNVYTGSDTFANLALKYKLSEQFFTNLTYSKYDYDFGDSEAIKLGLSFYFD